MRPGRGCRLAAGLLCLFAVIPVTAASGAASKDKRAGAPIPASPRWKQYVIDPGNVVYPKSVFVTGSPTGVQDTSGLKARGGGATTITSTGVGEKGVGSTAL